MEAVEEKKIYPMEADSYVLRAEIGRGAFASVYMATCPELQEDVAVKILALDELQTSWDEVRKEITMMHSLLHPNVVRCYCSFVVGKEIWLIMPLLSGGSCADILKKNFPNGFDDEALIATLLRNTLLGLEYFHNNGSIHRDVKAGNILISAEGEVQMADFGVAGSMIEAGLRRDRQTFVGTPCWMAPEVMEQQEGYSYSADIWSFGITAMELAYGRPPYSHYQPMKVMLLTLQDPPPTPAVYADNPKSFSKAFVKMVASCLQKDPSKRPSAKELLKHKFFKSAKDSEYIKGTLLSAITRPKWLDSPEERIERPQDQENEVECVFDIDELEALKDLEEQEKPEDEVKGRFQVSHVSAADPSNAPEPEKKGRFVVHHDSVQ